MNSKKMFTSAIVFWALIVVYSCAALPIKADDANPFLVVSTPMAVTPETQFALPTTNGSINFGQTGYYDNATLAGDAWVFNGLQLDSQQADVLSDSPNSANLNITTTNSNITIDSFERLLTPDVADNQNTGIWLTPGWLNYTVNGVGTQIIRLNFDLANWTEPQQNETNVISTWPINVNVYVDGKEAQFNTNWTNVEDIGMIPYGTGIIVTGATSNVSINYAWVPVPEPAGESSSSTHITGLPTQNPLIFYLVVVAVATVIIIPTALFINRHHLAQTFHHQKADLKQTANVADGRKKE